MTKGGGSGFIMIRIPFFRRVGVWSRATGASEKRCWCTCLFWGMCVFEQQYLGESMVVGGSVGDSGSGIIMIL